jgi:hypothetical protein
VWTDEEMAESAAIEMNIKLARSHFGKLEAIGMGK